jgi:hypothetical protein
VERKYSVDAWAPAFVASLGPDSKDVTPEPLPRTPKRLWAGRPTLSGKPAG